MIQLELSPWLLDSIKTGKAILFLGAGASYGALKSSKNTEFISGEKLKNLISEKFLNNSKRNWSLAKVADYAVQLSSLFDVQNFIFELFKDYEPANFHKIISKFKWHAIVTTNYDLIIEKVYSNRNSLLQELCPIYCDDDRFGNKLSDDKKIPYLKLHGCVTKINDSKLPLILTSEQYSKYSDNRKRLFSHLKEWGREYPIIFCGYEIDDPNIQKILFDLTDDGVKRPRYALVKPALDELDIKVWSARRFDVINLTFEDFLTSLDSKISDDIKKLSFLPSTTKLSINKWISTNDLSPSSELNKYLTESLEHIHDNMTIKKVKPVDFYSGISDDWNVFVNELDIRRKCVDDLLTDCFLGADPKKNIECILLRGYAGSGKNIALKRTAYEASINYNHLVFYLKTGAVIKLNVIEELYSLVKTRIYIFISDIIDHLPEFIDIAKNLIKRKLEITFIFGARNNEWNNMGDELAPFIDKEYELRDLSKFDAINLLEKLEAHDCLGYLKALNKSEREQNLTFSSERQILVALHEATSGKSFEEIVYNEYKNILPYEAQALYLDICTLNRLNVPVRAGLISRVSCINFSSFKSDFLKPLERVVKFYIDKRSRDYVYVARHPLIAKFVFEQALSDPKKRQEQILRILKYLNIDYKWDYDAFCLLIKGRLLAELFAEKLLGDQIYDVAKQIGADINFIHHQQSVFELNHPNGLPHKALQLLNFIEDESITPAIMHTKATVYRKMALSVQDNLEKAAYRKEAKILLNKLPIKKNYSYICSVNCQIILDEIKDRLSENNSDHSNIKGRIIIDLIKELEELIFDGLQKYPNDQYLLAHQLEFYRIIKNNEKASILLIEEFAKTPQSELLGIRLGKQYQESGEYDKANTTLYQCLKYNPGSKRLHFLLAINLLHKNEKTYVKDILSHLKKSFTFGDTNFEAQIYYARHHFLYGDIKKAEQIFKLLKTRNCSPKLRNKSHAVVKDSTGADKMFQGKIIDLTDSHCFVQIDLLGYSVFLHYSDITQNTVWDNLRIGSKLTFNLAFSMLGPKCINTYCL